MTKSIDDNKLHPRNKHRQDYDFDSLVISSPELSNYVILNKFGKKSISFFDANSVKALNRALLINFYNIKYWDIPEGYLCPPIPGRADYIHNIADLISKNGKVPMGPEIKIMDIGVGANCVYPIIGHEEYGWSFTGIEIDEIAFESAQNIIKLNPKLKGAVELRFQKNGHHIFKDILTKEDRFDVCMCNPPFHSSAEEAIKGNLRKLRGIQKNKTKKEIKSSLNFGGQPNELWCDGGESAFIRNMILESVDFSNQINWFTTLASNESNLPEINRLLVKIKVSDIKIINMSQGNKISRIVAWTFD